VVKNKYLLFTLISNYILNKPDLNRSNKAIYTKLWIICLFVAVMQNKSFDKSNKWSVVYNCYALPQDISVIKFYLYLSHVWFLFSNLNSLYSNHLKFIQKVRYLKRKTLSLISNFSVSARPWNLQDNCQFYQNFFRTFFNNSTHFCKVLQNNLRNRWAWIAGLYLIFRF
jgi:hypothetical protein